MKQTVVHCKQGGFSCVFMCWGK